MNICPSLFKPTATVDGILTRIRIPFGVIDLEQIEAIISIPNISNSIHITNRANIQIRTSEPLPNSVLSDFQNLGLAAQNPDLDHLRNVMISPTAGIDRKALIDSRPLAIAWLKHLEHHPELAILSPKFSIGIDGGESVSISSLLNDVTLQAVQVHGGTHTVGNQIYFSLSLINVPAGVLIKPDQTLEVLAALTEVYRQYTIEHFGQHIQNNKPPRIRDLINDWGMNAYLERVDHNLTSPLSPTQRNDSRIATNKYAHLGVHPQNQPELAYIGLVVPLGRLELSQFQGLGNIAKSYGNGYISLTPYQNLIISDTPHLYIPKVKAQIEELGLSIDLNYPYAGIVACSGSSGCKSSMTDTQFDARAIAESIQKSIVLNHPINIHLTGCEKSCAQHHQGDLTLLGIDADTYQVFVDDNFGSKFGRELYGEYPKSDLPNLISELIQTYQSQRKNDDQSFREFVNCQTISDLKNSLDHVIRRGK
jgi:ferredoxin-nitrite reductase